MNEQLLINDLAILLDMSIDDVNMSLDLSAHSHWDSLSIISLIGAIDEHYGINISGEELMKVVVVGDIFTILKQLKQ